MILNKIKLIAISIFGVVLLIGIYQLWNWHKDEIEKAEKAKEIEILFVQQQKADEREAFLREKYLVIFEDLQKQLEQEQNRTKNLRDMLEIEHDLDQLLQHKPGLILPRVNKGTKEYFDNLREATK